MRSVPSLTAALLVAALAVAAPAVAQDEKVGKNDFGGFRNVLAVGQGQTVNALGLAANQATGAVPAAFTNQLPLYRDLVYAAPGLKAADIDSYFKSEGFGIAGSDIASTEHPRPGVTIVRDAKYNVPRVYGDTRTDTMFGAGYASAEDRLFLMDVLRHTGRATLSEFAGPGTGDANVKMDADQLLVSDYSEQELQGQIDDGVARLGAEGAQARQDVLDYVAGINQYISEARADPSKMPGEYAALGKQLEDWKPTDSVAVASLIGGIFGRGGGREKDAAQVLLEAQKKFGRRKGRAVFRDFRRRDDPEAPVTVKQRFGFDNPGRPSRKAVALPDLGSVKLRNPIVSGSEAQITPTSTRPDFLGRLGAEGLGLSGPASNALLIAGKRSKTGKPFAVMGPQVGFYSPEILMEMELHGPGIDARGATFPGVSLYVLIGRGQDFAWSATTSTADVVDEFVERLCEPDGSKPTADSTHYAYKGKCVPMVVRDHVIHTSPSAASTAPPRTITMQVQRTIHGPVQARATVKGDPVAVAEARSSYFHEVDSTIFFKRLNENSVTDAKSFLDATRFMNFAFNWFYVDDRDIAFRQSGVYPRRARGTDPDLPAWGTGPYDWQGFDGDRHSERDLPFGRLPQTVNPPQGYMVNWNNKQAPGWRSADDNWVYSSVHRSQRLEKRVRAALRSGGKMDVTQLVQAMALAAGTDLRGQESYPWIRKVIGRSADPATAKLLAVLDAWQRGGSFRRDLDRDNVLDDSPAVALMDAWWTPMIKGVFEPVIGPALLSRVQVMTAIDDAPPANSGSSFFNGWWGYLDKDLRSLLGKPVRQPLSRRYCGAGSVKRCREILISTLKTAAAKVAEAQGPDTSKWKVPATCDVTKPKGCDQIEFTTAGAIGTAPIPWQDRPTFQQVVEVQGHRPR